MAAGKDRRGMVAAKADNSGKPCRRSAAPGGTGEISNLAGSNPRRASEKSARAGTESRRSAKEKRKHPRNRQTLKERPKPSRPRARRQTRGHKEIKTPISKIREGTDHGTRGRDVWCSMSAGVRGSGDRPASAKKTDLRMDIRAVGRQCGLLKKSFKPLPPNQQINKSTNQQLNNSTNQQLNKSN